MWAVGSLLDQTRERVQSCPPQSLRALLAGPGERHLRDVGIASDVIIRIELQTLLPCAAIQAHPPDAKRPPADQTLLAIQSSEEFHRD